MSEVGMRSDVQSVLAQMKLMRAQAEAGIQQQPRIDETQPSDSASSFATMLQSATASVNALQQQSGDASERFVTGASNDLVSVMIASQKANVAFQGLVHTRNHMINAYQEIMKMAI